MLEDLQTTSTEFCIDLTIRLRGLRVTQSSEEITSALWELLSKIDEEFAYLDVIRELCVEHTRMRKHDDIADLHALALSRFPTSLNAHLAYAEHLVWSETDPALALKLSNTAVDLARNKNTLVRHALQCKARAAKKLALYSLVEETLEQILLTDQMGIHGDIQYEADVIRGIPEGSVDPQVIEEFRSRCAAAQK